MKHPENEFTVNWLREQLEKHESGVMSGHATIVIDIRDRRACKVEPGEKVLIPLAMKSA